jgi:Mg-chelatase subunit ChlD
VRGATDEPESIRRGAPETLAAGPRLKHHQAKYRTVIPETRIGFGRRRRVLREVVLCINRSGSMATSVVEAPSASMT